jgi:inner membrane protein
MLAAPHFGQDALGPVGLGLAVAGSLLPDIDHPKSWAGRRLRPSPPWSPRCSATAA